MGWTQWNTLRGTGKGNEQPDLIGFAAIVAKPIRILHEMNFMIADMQPFGNDKRTDSFVLFLQFSRSKPF